MWQREPQLNLQFNQNEFDTRLAKLKAEFPIESLVVLNAGTKLFHVSRNIDKLLTERLFDPAASFQNGAFSFSLAPSEVLPLVVVETDRPLILFDRDVLGYKSPLAKRVKSTPGNGCNLAINEGFDGEITSTSSVLLNGKEVIINPKGLEAINKSIKLFDVEKKG